MGNRRASVSVSRQSTESPPHDLWKRRADWLEHLEHLEILKYTYREVKAEFSDLDGLRWTSEQLALFSPQRLPQKKEPLVQPPVVITTVPHLLEVNRLINPSTSRSPTSSQPVAFSDKPTSSPLDPDTTRAKENLTTTFRGPTSPPSSHPNRPPIAASSSKKSKKSYGALTGAGGLKRTPSFADISNMIMLENTPRPNLPVRSELPQPLVLPGLVRPSPRRGVPVEIDGFWPVVDDEDSSASPGSRTVPAPSPFTIDDNKFSVIDFEPVFPMRSFTDAIGTGANSASHSIDKEIGLESSTPLTAPPPWRSARPKLPDSSLDSDGPIPIPVPSKRPSSRTPSRYLDDAPFDSDAYSTTEDTGESSNGLINSLSPSAAAHPIGPNSNSNPNPKSRRASSRRVMQRVSSQSTIRPGRLAGVLGLSARSDSDPYSDWGSELESESESESDSDGDVDLDSHSERSYRSSRDAPGHVYGIERERCDGLRFSISRERELSMGAEESALGMTAPMVESRSDGNSTMKGSKTKILKKEQVEAQDRMKLDDCDYGRAEKGSDSDSEKPRSKSKPIPENKNKTKPKLGLPKKLLKPKLFNVLF